MLCPFFRLQVEDDGVQAAREVNLQHALRVALLLLPKRFVSLSPPSFTVLLAVCSPPLPPPTTPSPPSRAPARQERLCQSA